MITIDGSRLEGGGQLVRAAVALAALSGEGVAIENIRARRKNPGLRSQHIAAVRAVAGACGAECTGLSVGSGRLRFVPGPLRERSLQVDVGTAGSIPLVLQAWLPAATVAGGTIRVSGGTEVAWSPTIDYAEHVFLRALRDAGAAVELRILRRGYFPRGGGLVEVVAAPSDLSPVRPSPEGAGGIISCSSNLPAHVAERQAKAAATRLLSSAGELPVTLDRREELETGSSCTVWQAQKGGCAIGRRGYPAERVGEDAADALLAELASPASVDLHLADQLILYLARYGGSFTAPSLSLHAATMCWLCGEFGLTVSHRTTQAGLVEVRA
ncbi:MAG TPA: RNA 3'-terminal phosphate cyclase [Methanoculleus sp.]|nr:RNA 3'-terminal phosphate cyclase [Methanoculleus sp.]